jgi:iron complex outermembrane recepter protein
MFRSILQRGVSVGALILVTGSFAAVAQERLPTIDIGNATPRTLSGAGGDGPNLRADSNDPLADHAGDRKTGYNAERTTAVKLDKPILQTPIAVQTVTRQTMDDQQAISVQDAVVGNVSSVAPAPGGVSYWQSLTIRGFTTTSVSGFGMSQTYRNGLLQPFWVNPSTANVQSIEVVKGPGSVLYGRVEPGGLVDLIIKRPLETPYYSIEEQAGSFGLTRTTVDATGPLTVDKTWLYRVTGQYMHSGSFVDYVRNQDGFGSATITYHPSDQFKFNLDIEYQDSLGTDNGANFPAFGNRPAPIPISRYLEDPSVTVNNPDHYMRRFVGYDWEYKLDNNWSVVNRFSYSNSRKLNSGEFFNCLNNPPYPTACGGATPGVGVNSLIWGPSALRSLSNSVDVKGKFWTGPFEHSMLFGADHVMSSSVGDSHYVFNAQRSYPWQPPFDIFYPIYSGTGLTGLLTPKNGFALIKQQEWQGIYGQDLISFLDDRIHLLLGGRYDWASATSGVQSSSNAYVDNALALASAKAVHISDGAFSPRVGLVIQPLPWLSFYGNFTQSFGLNNGLNKTTLAPLGSQKAEQWEGGVKAELFDKRLMATFAYFDIKKTNVAQASSAVAAVYNLLDARSRGVELDITGRLDENWSLIANFSHTEAKVVKGSPFNPKDPLDLVNEAPVAGTRLPGVPDNMGSFWVKYDADGAYKGLSAAVGFSRIGVAQGDPANSFQMPAYSLLRAMLSYRFPVGGTHVTAQINADNLLNDRYFYGATSFNNRFSLTPGAPRGVLGSLRVEF